jgi:hypothetical protein
MQRLLRDRLENVGIKRAIQKSAGVTQRLMSNNRYESAMPQLAPAFLPKRGPFLRAPPWATTCTFGRCSFPGGVFVRRPSRGSDQLGFGGVEPETTGRPACHPATPLKIYVYGYLNRVQSSRRRVAGGSDQPIPAPWPDRMRHVSTAINSILGADSPS